VGGEIRFNSYGQIVAECWADLVNHYPCLEVMPNHLHGIIVFTEDLNADAGAGLKPTPTYGLPEIVQGFKTFSSRRINQIRETLGTPIWQHSYFDHIIRNECDLNRIRQYILDNPAKRPEDEDNPQT
jgi:putative transposase